PNPGGTGSTGRGLAGDGQQGAGGLRRPWLAADIRPFGTHPGHRTPPQTRPLARIACPRHAAASRRPNARPPNPAGPTCNNRISAAPAHALPAPADTPVQVTS